jgi:EmrB/QacA subfamily drug resistance transporter
MSVVAVEVTVVTTAMPTVIGELGGLELYPWVFSAYLLTSTVTVPIFGKLADLHGRRRIFLGGLAVFLLGSVLCGTATSMPLLVAYRALQGLGAGAVQPLVFTIIGDVYPLEQRGKVQGLFSLVWGITSLAGPAFGAFITLTWSWRWVFYVNVPFCMLAAWFISRYLHERVQRRDVEIDAVGAATLCGGLLLLMVTLLEGGRSVAWGSPLMLGLLVLGLGLLGAFLTIERRSAAPILPLELFRRRIFAVSAAENLLQGGQLFALTAYIPLYIQGVRGENAAGSGVALTPLLVAWCVTGTFGPRLLLRAGFQRTALFGTGLLLLGTLPLTRLEIDMPWWLLVVSMVLLGGGFGPCMSAFVMAVQSAVPWEQRGVATSNMQLYRNLGGTISIALLGALLNAGLQRLAPGGAATRAALLDGGLQASVNPAELAALRAALSEALVPVFWVIALLALTSVVIAAAFGRIDLREALVERGGSGRSRS